MKIDIFSLNPLVCQKKNQYVIRKRVVLLVKGYAKCQCGTN